MKKEFQYGLLGWLLLTSCHSVVNSSTAYNVAGSYQLIGCDNLGAVDTHPAGTIEVIQVDEEHISLLVQGVSGKAKLTYSYTAVLVVDAGQNSLGQDSYKLLYQGRNIGLASNDGVGRYLSVMPSTGTLLKSADL